MEGRQVHLYMVTIDSFLMIQMAQGTASQVDDYKGVEYLHVLAGILLVDLL